MAFSLKRGLADVATGGLNELTRTPLVKGALFGSGGKNTNPYQTPNVDFLRQPAATTNYDFLKTPVDVSNQYRSQSSFYNAPANTSTPAAASYLQSINAPSSVDAVRGEVNNQALQNTLGDIQRTTNQNLGTNLINSFSRGLYDPQSGADSDIARIGLAQTAAEGGRTAAKAYTDLAGQNLDLQKQREQAQNAAQSQIYGTAVGADTQNRTLAANAAAGDQASRQALISQGANLTNQNSLAYGTGQQANTDAENQRRYQLAQILTGQAGDQSKSNIPPSYGAVGDLIKQGVSKLPMLLAS